MYTESITCTISGRTPAQKEMETEVTKVGKVPHVIVQLICDDIKEESNSGSDVDDHCDNPSVNVNVKIEQPNQSLSINEQIGLERASDEQISSNDGCNNISKLRRSSRKRERFNYNTGTDDSDGEAASKGKTLSSTSRKKINAKLKEVTTEKFVKRYRHYPRKLVCNICGTGFPFQSHLDVHLRTHSGERPFLCNICDQKFACLATLRQHQHLIHSSEKPHKCDVCDKRFKRRSDVNRHRVMHTGEKKYECEVCGKKFTRNTSLWEHRASHPELEASQRNKCDTCGDGFLRKVDLASHMNQHTGERPYVCPMCEKGFISQVQLNQHRRRHGDKHK